MTVRNTVEIAACVLNMVVPSLDEVTLVDADDVGQIRVVMNPHASIGRVMLLEELIERPVTGGNRRVDGPRQPIILRVGHQCRVIELVGVSVHRYQDAVPALLFDLVAPLGDGDYGC